jgi:predicted SAM-dependent methyltransferase
MDNNVKMLNLGCGSRFHKDWDNIDFVSNSPFVKQHNLLKGIPFPDATFDVVYHSHVLEHFTKSDGVGFLKECFRVLKPDGILRLAVPDLEQIVRLYLKNLENATDGNEIDRHNYEWIMLELFDQTVRNRRGGDMVNYLRKEKLLNEEFIYSRLGEEARIIRENFLRKKAIEASTKNTARNSFGRIKRVFHLAAYKEKLKILLFKNDLNALEIGHFRLGGEIHQWMYDRYSLKVLLTELGFLNFEVTTAFESKIPNWERYELESKQGVIFKPDSLFVEAIKP